MDDSDNAVEESEADNNDINGNENGEDEDWRLAESTSLVGFGGNSLERG